MSPEGKHGIVPCLLLVAAVCLLYGNTLGGGFVWDDNLFTANRVYWSFDFRKILLSLANGLEYQPVRDLTYLLDIALWQGRPAGFHLTNLVLFAAVVVLAYRTAAALYPFVKQPATDIPDRFVPFFTALLFAVHPLKSEVVAWATQRNTLLAALFFFLATLCFLRYLENGEKKQLLLSLAAFSLALLSKAIVVTLPLLLLLLVQVRQGGGRRDGRILPALVPFFLLAGAGAALHVAIARKTAVISSAYYGSWSERLAVAVQIPFFYLKKTLLPVDLSPFYAVDFARSPASAGVVAAAILLAAAVGAAWLLRGKCPELLIGGGWFGITLLPFANLFATSPVAADRYFFLPSFGLVFAAVAMISRVRLSPGALAAVPLLLGCLLAPATFRQNGIWHDDIALWSRAAQLSPRVAGVWFNLGRAWHRTPRLSMALEAYLRALQLDPGDVNSLDNAAALFPLSRGSLPARQELVRSLGAQMPGTAGGLALIGYTEVEWQHPDAAEELFLSMLEAENRSLDLRLALANLYRKLGAFDRATALYGEIVASGEGRGEAEFGLAAVAAANGNRQESGRLLALAKGKGGVPQELLRRLNP